jgi:hypothetical protein
MKKLMLVTVLVNAVLSGCAAPEQALMPAAVTKDKALSDVTTPYSVCVQLASERYSSCLAAKVFTTDTCQAFYQQAVDICSSQYN